MSSLAPWLEDWRACAAAKTNERRPFVTACFALSADDCLARARGEPPAISSLDARLVAHRLRAVNDAVLVGVGTVLSDDPVLATRLVKGPTGLRVVLDSRLRTPPSARLLHSAEGRVLVFGSLGAEAVRSLTLRAVGAQVELVNQGARGLELSKVLERLMERGVGTLLVEGGARVLESFFSAGLVDYVCLTRAPRSVREPESVLAGPRTREALERWVETLELDAGGDHLGFGSWLAFQEGVQASSPFQLSPPSAPRSR